MSAQMPIEEYEKLFPHLIKKWKGRDVIFCIPNRVALWRVETLEEKEPDTLEWIFGFEAGQTFVDIGANVGMYSILVGTTPGMRVFAFEPESQNYALLTKNIMANQIQKNTTAFCAAISDKMEFGDLFLSGFETGQSCHTFGESIDFNLKPFETPFRQGSIAFTLDELVANSTLPCPTHIKIDVDGIEHKVIKGAMTTLGNTDVKSVLVELNTNLEIHREILTTFSNLGFQLWEEKLEIAIRKEGPFTGVGNHIFRR